MEKAGLLIAAPASGSGKTVVTLGLLRSLRDRGISISGAKAGPDYIDPGFHALASGEVSFNLDPWAMAEQALVSYAHATGGSHVLVEGMMGLFDGAADGTGSAASLAKVLNVPVILVVDASKQSHSIAALIRGFRDHDQHVTIAGIILNKVGSARHETMLRKAIEPLGVPVFGTIARDERMGLPERHLGLVQAREHAEMEAFIEHAAQTVSQSCDLPAIQNAFKPVTQMAAAPSRLKPLGQHIAIGQDDAFSFCYPHMVSDWREQGAEVSYFSPLQNERPNGSANAIFLPGGYPELHAEKLAHADEFKSGMEKAAEAGTLIYGECGGYMVLGETLVDKDGVGHAMLGLLALETSFQKRKLHLGYRVVEAEQFQLGNAFKAHEFHYTSAIKEAGEPLFQAADAIGNSLGPSGLRNGSVMGSYMHLIHGAD